MKRRYARRNKTFTTGHHSRSNFENVFANRDNKIHASYILFERESRSTEGGKFVIVKEKEIWKKHFPAVRFSSQMKRQWHVSLSRWNSLAKQMTVQFHWRSVTRNEDPPRFAQRVFDTRLRVEEGDLVMAQISYEGGRSSLAESRLPDRRENPGIITAFRRTGESPT